MNGIKAPADLIGRIMISLLFLYSGYLKIVDYDRQLAYAQNGFNTNLGDISIPTVLFWVAIAFEIAAGILIILGLWTRLVAFLLAGYAVLTAVIFHTVGIFDINVVVTEAGVYANADLAQAFTQYANITTSFNFFKNITIAGALLIVAIHGAGAWSMDASRRRAAM